MPVLTKIIFGFLVFLALSSAAADTPVVEEFRYHLASADCDYARANRAFGLKLMGRDFPMPDGYDFRGSDHFSGRDWLRFQTPSNLDPLRYIQENPETNTAEAVRNVMAQQAHVYYYEEDEAENLDAEEYRGFEVVEWNGLSLLITMSTGGQVQRTTVYQAIVRAEGDNDRLWFSSTNIKQITKIIACATIAE